MLPEEKCKLAKAKETLDEHIANTNDILSKRKSQIDAILDKAHKTESIIKNHFWKAMEFLLSEDRRLIKELNVHKDQQLNQVHAHIDEDYNTLQLYQGKSKIINRVLESENDENITDVEELCRSVDNMNSPSSEENNPVDEIKFVHEPDMLLRAIRRVHHEIIVIDRSPQRPTPVFHHLINTRTSEDKIDPDVRNVTVAEAQGIKITLVTDWKNRSIKSFYKLRNELKQNVLVTGGWPFGITSIGDKHAFVTDPVLKRILKLSVYPDIRVSLTISTEKMYCGIASLDQSRLVASGYEWSNSWASFWTVDILDTNGVLLKSIKDRVLQSPEYICTSPSGSIVASDKGSRSLVYLSCEGDEYLTVTPTGENLYRLPQGVAVTKSGDVLLVDSITNKVIEMTDSGELIRDLLTFQDGIEKPRAIYADDDGYVYITCEDVIRVYRYT